MAENFDIDVYPDNYSFGFRSSGNSDSLVVTVSPTKNFSFFRVPFRHDVLYVGDNSGLYYTRDIRIVATAISEFVIRHGYAKAAFVGGSKAGYGALLLSQLCGQMLPGRLLLSLAFSPQVLIHPRDEPLSFPSYAI